MAIPRVTGSEAREAVATMLATELDALGFATSRETFPASPRRLYAVAAGAAGVGWTTLLVFPLLVLPLPGWSALGLGGAGFVVAVLLGHGIAIGALPIRYPSVPGHNLVATRDAPRIWLVAHADSKGQFLSLRGRVIAIVVGSVAVLGLIACLVARLFAPIGWSVALPLCVAVVAAGAALVRDPLRNDSPGAVDNATGVVAALVAAAEIGARRDVGVLITDAEEFGMEGARAWVQDRSPDARFINFDGLDAAGRYRIMEHRRPGRSRQANASLSDSVAAAFADAGLLAIRRPLPPGVLVDGVILGAAGMDGVTVSRGDWSTLGVVHTERDVIGRTDVSSAAAAGRAVAEAITTLLG